MSQQELLNKVVLALEQLSIDYMLTGSLASSAQGEPRATHDIDLVVQVSPKSIPGLLRAFPPPDYYLSADAIRDAINHRTMFNLLSLTDGEKVDFWILKDEPFDQSCFQRKRVDQIFGMAVKIGSPEDTILAKLRWEKLSGGSEKQFTDCLRVFEIQFANLDLGYLDHWAKDLDVQETWDRLRLQAKPVSE